VPLLPSQDLVKPLLVLPLARFNHITERCDLTFEGRHAFLNHDLLKKALS